MSADHCDVDRSGTIASLLARALRGAGHDVVHGVPTIIIGNEDVDHTFIGLSSPLSVGSGWTVSCLAMLERLSEYGGVSVFFDDPDVKKISTGLRKVARDPTCLLDDFLARKRRGIETDILSMSLDAVGAGAGLLARPRGSAGAIRAIVPRHAWNNDDSLVGQLPAGVRDVSIDFTGLLLEDDSVIDMGVAARARGVVQERGDAWVCRGATTSRAADTWIERTRANILWPCAEGSDVRRDLVAGFGDALLARGVLEQPPSVGVPGWWTPWQALAVGSGGVYLTDPGVGRRLDVSFSVLPAYYEALSRYEKDDVTMIQRRVLRDLADSPATIARRVLDGASVNV